MKVCPVSHAYGIADDHGQDAEADGVAERIYLNTEFLFAFGAVFLCTGDLTVEHITQSRYHKAYYGIFGVRSRAAVADCEEHTDNGGDEAHICKNNRIVIVSNHLSKPQTA